MKCARLLRGYFKFPEGINDIESFAEYMNEHYHSYVKLIGYRYDKCVPPYFIEEETFTTYINASSAVGFDECEIAVLSREEYDERLRKVISEKCVHCKDYIDDPDIESHRCKISLDGECDSFEEIDCVEPKYQS